MKTFAYFENIHEQLTAEIGKADFSITATMDCFSDNVIFNLLCSKAAKNIQLRLLLTKDTDDMGKHDRKIIRLQNLSGDVYCVPKRNLMHNKFCVIDNRTILTGAFSWRRPEGKNYEYISVVKGNPALVKQFLNYFEEMRSRHEVPAMAKGSKIDHAQTLCWLEELKNIMLFGCAEDIQKQGAKINLFPSNPISEIIISLIENHEYIQVVERINEFKDRLYSVTEYQDVEKKDLSFELEVSQLIVNIISDEKDEIDRQMHTFNVYHHRYLGDLIRKYLYLRKEKLRQERKIFKTAGQQYVKAENDFAEYKNQFESSAKESNVNPLDEQAENKLKETYRKATKLCHPDMVAVQDKDQANDVFSQLQSAYKSNDISGVNSILSQLRHGNLFTVRSAYLSETASMKHELFILRRRIKKLVAQINALIRCDAWKTIASISDWEAYFKQQREKLNLEIEVLTKDQQ